MILFWSLFIIFILFTLLFITLLILVLLDRNTDERSDKISFGICGTIVFSLFLAALIYNYDYSENKLERLYPEDVTVLNEEFSVTIKYKDYIHIIDSKPDLPLAQDSCFYIDRTEYFNFLGNSEIIEYKTIVTDQRIFKPTKL